MMIILKKIKLSLAISVLSRTQVNTLSSQCLTLNCAPSITIAAPNGSCAAVVNYSAPIVLSTCALVVMVLL